MKLFYFLLGILPLLLTTIISPTTVNGRFTVTEINGSKVSVLLQVNTNTGTDDLGGATIVFSFDTATINFPSNPVHDVDYVFHNCCGGSYAMATITRPMNDKIWVNIDLPLSNINNGKVISGSSGWTNLVTINFNLINEIKNLSLSWNTTSLFWGIYDADNSTLWQIGSFKNLIDFPLPVELTSFTAKVINCNVRLEWITSTEVDNYGFEILRSVQNNSVWKNIGFVEGHGNSNSPKHYSFIDDNVTGGSKFKYRLKQIDTDGDYEYSEIVEIEILPSNFSLDQNYPNPLNPTTNIGFQIAQFGFVSLKLFDILGNEVATLVNEEKPAGNYKVEFSAAGLPSGIYFYRLQSGPFVQTKKMILMK
jgi:hypothetical protein